MPRTRQVKSIKAKSVRSVRVFGRPAKSRTKRAAARAPGAGRKPGRVLTDAVIAKSRKSHEQHSEHAGVIDVRADIDELKQREASFRLLFDANPVPMIVCGLDGERILAVNDAAVEHYGYSRASSRS